MKKSYRLMIVLATLVTAGVQASPVITRLPGTLYNTTGLAGFAATGANMAGMTVDMCFVAAGCTGELSWGLLSDGSYGVAQTGWSLSASATGDTFDSPFVLNIGPGLALQSFTMGGRLGLTAFDTVNVPDMTVTNQHAEASANKSPGSGNGLPFELLTGMPANVATLAVAYSDRLYIGGTFYNDLYLTMAVSFTMDTNFAGFSGEMRFLSDTDRIAAGAPITLFDPGTPPGTVPLPGTLALAGLGLVGLGLSKRRRRAA